MFNSDFSPIEDITAPVMFGEPFGDLWFRARAVDADGVRSLLSNVRKVTIAYNAPIPPAPKLSAPANGAEATLPSTVDWTDDVNPQSYQLQIGTDPTFEQADQSECAGVEWCVRTIPESQWTVPNLDVGVHYWRVRSEHGASGPDAPALSAWSKVVSFTVPQTPVHIRGFTLDAISDGSVYSHNHAFSGATTNNRVIGRLRLDPFVPAAGQPVTLTSSDPSVVAVPATALVERPCCLDNTDALGTFTIDPKQVTVPTTVTITATLPTGSVSIPLTIDPPSPKRLQVFGPNGTVVLNGAAPADGAQVTFSSDNPALVAPAPVTVAAGAFQAPFTVTTNPVGVTTTVVLTATWGTSTVTLPITLRP